jgi:hypothetical protein
MPSSMPVKVYFPFVSTKVCLLIFALSLEGIATMQNREIRRIQSRLFITTSQGLGIAHPEGR